MANETKPAGKKHKKKKKSWFKPVYLVPIVIIIVIALVGGYVYSVSRHSGPVYGERCAGLTELGDDVLTDTVKKAREENEEIASLEMSVACRTIRINMKMADDLDDEHAKTAVEGILKILDETAGLEKSNEDSAYSDLLGVVDGEAQYHVDIIIDGNLEMYPIFASKHPSKDEVNYTLNTPRDEHLVEVLHEQQSGEGEETPEEETPEEENSDGEE